MNNVARRHVGPQPDLTIEDLRAFHRRAMEALHNAFVVLRKANDQVNALVVKVDRLARELDELTKELSQYRSRK